jgi:hypothetical protein
MKRLLQKSSVEKVTPIEKSYKSKNQLDDFIRDDNKDNSDNNDNIDDDFKDILKQKERKLRNNSRLTKKSYHGIDSRDSALTYLDGELYVTMTHPVAIEKFLGSNREKGKEIIEKYLEENNIGKDSEEGQDILNEFEQVGILSTDIFNAYSEYSRRKGYYQDFGDIPLAFAHIVNDGLAIYIEEDSLQNVELNTVVNKIKGEFPNFDIYNDDSYPEEDGMPEDYDKLANQLDPERIKKYKNIQKRPRPNWKSLILKTKPQYLVDNYYKKNKRLIKDRDDNNEKIN